MAQAIPISDSDWNFAVKVKTNLDLFNYHSRIFIAKQALPAEKIHPVEFFPKP